MPSGFPGSCVALLWREHGEEESDNRGGEEDAHEESRTIAKSAGGKHSSTSRLSRNCRGRDLSLSLSLPPRGRGATALQPMMPREDGEPSSSLETRSFLEHPSSGPGCRYGRVLRRNQNLHNKRTRGGSKATVYLVVYCGTHLLPQFPPSHSLFK